MPRKTANITGFVVVALAVCGCFIAAAMPFTAIREYLDSLAGDGSAEPYTPELHWRLRIYFVCLGIGALVGTGCLIVLTRRVEGGPSWIGRLADDGRQLSTDTYGFLRKHGVALAVLLFIGLLLRVPYLDQPMRYDEAHTFVNYANQPAYVTISTYKEPNNHVFHNLCVHMLTRLFGDAEWVIRLPALLAGLMTILATYALGHLWAGRNLGWLAALVVAAASPLIGYSVNARGYSLLCLITVCLFLLAHNTLQRDNRATWGIMTVLAALGFWTVPTMVYPFAMLLVWLCAMSFLQTESRTTIWLSLFVFVAATVGLTLLLYSPILIVEGPSALVNNRFIESPEWPEFVRRLPDTIAETGRLLFRDLPLPALMLLAFGAVLTFRPVRFRQNPAPTVLLLSSSVCVVMVLLQQVLPPARTWLFLLPLLVTSALWGMLPFVEAQRPVIRRTTIVILGALFVVWPLINLVRQDSIRQSRETGICPDAEAAVMWLKTGLLPREPVVAIVPSSAPLVYYALRHDLSLQHFEWPGGPHTRDDVAIVVVNPLWDPAETTKHVLDVLELEASFDENTPELVVDFPSAQLFRVQGRTDSE